ncbi:protein RecT-like [Procambarus clarkii]|uniref:protein RecT-like n=1 Tax=Procambarus clarkii TaxID=6728 RepID=UPI003741FE5B
MAKKFSIRPIKDIYAKVVREGDVFEEEILAGQQIINFKPISFNNNKIVGAFAVVLYDDGGMEYETMSAEQIESIRENFSKMKNGLMWTKTPEEAYKKTVLRRLVKKIEKDFKTVEAGKTFEESSDMQFKPEKEKVVVPDTFEDVEYAEVQEQPNEPTQEEIENIFGKEQ